MKDVENFELEQNIKFPKEYKEFLLTFNGGYPQLSLFKISEEGESIVNVFYGLNISKSYDELSNAYESLGGEIPEGFISIGDDSGGNQICLGVNDEYYGKLYFGFHGIEDNDEVSNMFFLANNFREFLNNLYDEE
ncbi:SMI1/KNR4 family protein [Bacillus proteolyticus]|uniref:SMI1/KNR4 family protein n=1 Tax=Bacillus proteolyticus TaxID=2026192 RepID=UPI003D02D5B5